MTEKHDQYLKLVASAEQAVRDNDHVILAHVLQGAANAQSFQVMHYAFEKCAPDNLPSILITILKAASPEHVFNHHSRQLFRLAAAEHNIELLDLTLQRIHNDALLRPSYIGALEFQSYDILKRLAEFFDQHPDPLFRQHLDEMIQSSVFLDDNKAAIMLLLHFDPSPNTKTILCRSMTSHHQDAMDVLWNTMSNEDKNLAYDDIMKDPPQAHPLVFVKRFVQERQKQELRAAVSDEQAAIRTPKM